MKEYDIFVPLFYNDGKAIEAAKFQELQEILLDRFEGLTFFPQPNKGFWKMAGVTYRDETVVYRVITSSEGARHFLEDLKDENVAFDNGVRSLVERDRMVRESSQLHPPAL